MIFFSAGFDAHREEGMASLKLTEADYAWLTKEIEMLAERYAHGRMVSALAGGYVLAALARSSSAHIRVLCDSDRELFKQPLITAAW